MYPCPRGTQSCPPLQKLYRDQRLPSLNRSSVEFQFYMSNRIPINANPVADNSVKLDLLLELTIMVITDNRFAPIFEYSIRNLYLWVRNVVYNIGPIRINGARKQILTN